MSFKLFSLLFLSVIFSSCAVFEHRDFYDEMVFSEFEEPLIIPGDDFEVVAGDSGRSYRSNAEIYKRTPATLGEKSSETYERSIAYELNSLENRLEDAQYHSYLRFRDEFSSDSERIYYLRLSPNEQQQYLEARGMVKSKNKDLGNSRSIAGNYSGKFLTQSSAISLGMDQNSVLGLWGRPVRRDISGNPNDKNERWAYQVGDKVKYIYFESGRVEGWSEQ